MTTSLLLSRTRVSPLPHFFSASSRACFSLFLPRRLRRLTMFVNEKNVRIFVRLIRNPCQLCAYTRCALSINRRVNGLFAALSCSSVFVTGKLRGTRRRIVVRFALLSSSLPIVAFLRSKKPRFFLVFFAETGKKKKQEVYSHALSHDSISTTWNAKQPRSVYERFRDWRFRKLTRTSRKRHVFLFV